MSAITFNANDVAPDKGLSPVPKGYYPVCIVDSELKPTKNGAGEIIALKLQVGDGAYKGKTILSNLNWKNANATAQNIGHAQLSAICYATGVMQPQDTQQLHNIPFGVEVCLTPDLKYNDVKAYMSLDDVNELIASGAKPPGPDLGDTPVGGVPVVGGGVPAPLPAPAPVAAPAPVPVPAAAPAVQPVPQPPVAAPPVQQPAPAPTPQQPAVAAPVAQAPANPVPVAQPAQAVATPVAEAAPVAVAPVEGAPTAETPSWIAAQQAAAGENPEG